ncbi:MAG: signal peptidase I [Saprospiraceae bacterium]|nr:signal peptidase I [Saprospiraceae bacterium]
MNTLIILIVLKLIALVGLYKIFEKENIPGWKAFVPVLNVLEWLKLIGKPSWWLAMLFIPLVNVFYLASMLTNLSNCFKRYSFFNHAAAVLTPFIYLPFLGFSKEEKYYGVNGLREGEKMPKKGAVREWVDALVFAVAAAHLIRVFFIEAYKIPTSSMEPSLQIGDIMFVSKAHYGSRVPNTPLGLPFMHHTIPFSKGKRAYSEAIKWDYTRLPGLQKVKRNDVVVFNIPFEHDMQSGWGKEYGGGVKYASRPVDKKEHYIKRAVGIPGDSIEIRSNQLYVNGQPADNPDLLQFTYRYESNTTPQNLDDYGSRAYINHRMGGQNPDVRAKVMDVPAKNKALMESHPDVSALTVTEHPIDPRYFPYGMVVKKGWSISDYGPLWIPKKGTTIQLPSASNITQELVDNFNIYRECIEVYEGNQVEVNGNNISINGEVVDSYTFKMDYYWMMGDNRHRSLDSRAWGFVPEDHIVGKPLFIFFSSEGGPGNPGIKWKRFFKGAQDMN